MRFKGCMRRVSAVFVAAAALSTLSVAPATAESTVGSAGAGGAAFNICEGAHCVVGTLNTRVYPTGLGVDLVEFECTVTATATAASVTISTCSVGGVESLTGPISAPGSAVTTAGTGFFKAGSTVSACIGGSAVFIESVFGPPSLSDSACNNILVVAI